LPLAIDKVEVAEDDIRSFNFVNFKAGCPEMSFVKFATLSLGLRIASIFECLLSFV